MSLNISCQPKGETLTKISYERRVTTLRPTVCIYQTKV
nr:MAG TPA: hypothetical protein [Caudoviricetes sp.]